MKSPLYSNGIGLNITIISHPKKLGGILSVESNILFVFGLFTPRRVAFYSAKTCIFTPRRWSSKSEPMVFRKRVFQQEKS